MPRLYLSRLAQATMATMPDEDIVVFEAFFARIAAFPGPHEPPGLVWSGTMPGIYISEYLKRPFRFRRLDNRDIRIMDIYAEQ